MVAVAGSLSLGWRQGFCKRIADISDRTGNLVGVRCLWLAIYIDRVRCFMQPLDSGVQRFIRHAELVCNPMHRRFQVAVSIVGGSLKHLVGRGLLYRLN